MFSRLYTRDVEVEEGCMLGRTVASRDFLYLDVTSLDDTFPLGMLLPPLKRITSLRHEINKSYLVCLAERLIFMGATL